MNENLQEFVNSRGVDVRVDRQQSVIRGVKVLGLRSSNGRVYLPAALAAAVGLYEGAKVNLNHPKGNPLAARDYQDRLGSIRNVSVRGGQGLFGDFHFNPKHALAEQLLWDAQHAPESVGFSHNVEARTSQRAGRTVVEAILKVQSVDLVADPATTRSLYESDAAGAIPSPKLVEALTGVTLQDLRAARPDLIEAVGSLDTERVATLEAEIDRLRASEAVRQRRALAVRLLKEFKLPDPDAGDATSRAIVSELFLETLLAAPSEQAMRTLVEERATMLATVRKLDRGATSPARPVSREQNEWDPARKKLDAKAFAEAIL